MTRFLFVLPVAYVVVTLFPQIHASVAAFQAIRVAFGS